MQGGVWHSGLEKSKRKCPEGQHISSAKFQRERAETNKSKGCRVPGKRKGECKQLELFSCVNIRLLGRLTSKVSSETNYIPKTPRTQFITLINPHCEKVPKQN